MTMILYGNRASGHSWKVRQALVLLGIAHDYVAVDLRAPRGARGAEFERASPFGEIPVLVEDGRVYAQSNAILLKLARDTGRLGGDDVALLERWLFWEANRIGYSTANLRWEMVFAKDRNPALIDALRARTHTDLDTLDARLSAVPFILGTDLSVADLACAAYLQYADEARLDLSRWPWVEGWLARIAAMPGVEHPHALMADDRARVDVPPSIAAHRS